MRHVALLLILVACGQRPQADHSARLGPPFGAGAGLVTCSAPAHPSLTCAVTPTPPVPPAYNRCCYTLSPATSSCSTGGCPSGELACDGPDDCTPGYACIIHLGRSRCALASVPPDLRLCRTSADCLAVAPTCAPHPVVPSGAAACQ